MHLVSYRIKTGKQLVKHKTCPIFLHFPSFIWRFVFNKKNRIHDSWISREPTRTRTVKFTDMPV